MTESTTILLLITKMEGAGAQKMMLETARYLQRLPDWRVIAACLYDQHYIEEALRKFGVPVLDLKMKDTRPGRPLIANGLRVVKGCVQLYRLLRAESVQLLQTYDFYANAIGAVVGRLARVRRVVMSQRGVYVRRWRFWVDRAVARWADKITAVSESVREFSIKVEQIPADRIVIIRNGINVCEYKGASDRSRTRSQYGLTDDTCLVGTIGRLSQQKGHSILIKAASLVLESVPNVKFMIVGQGPELAALNAQIDQLHLRESFILTGHVPDVRPLLAAMDLYVHPSLWEGMPNTVLEAMASVKPIIATRVDGTVEMIIDKESGILIPPNDVPALASSIIHLLTHEETARRLAEGAYCRVSSHFSLDATMAATVDLYSALVHTTDRT